MSTKKLCGERGGWGGGVKGAYDEEVGTETWEKAGKSHMASAHDATRPVINTKPVTALIARTPVLFLSPQFQRFFFVCSATFSVATISVASYLASLSSSSLFL